MIASISVSSRPSVSITLFGPVMRCTAGTDSTKPDLSSLYMVSAINGVDTARLGALLNPQLSGMSGKPSFINFIQNLSSSHTHTPGMYKSRKATTIMKNSGGLQSNADPSG